jgi:hypothetical protein
MPTQSPSEARVRGPRLRGAEEASLAPRAHRRSGAARTARRRASSTSGRVAFHGHASRRTIRGWVNYYRHLVSSRVFTKVDTAIFDAMVRWMRRQHPRKGLAWLRTRYFRSSEHRHWIITAATWKADGSVSYSDLFQASSVPIRRHVKVQQAATAFDPAFREYFLKLRKTRTQTKAAEHVGSFRASAARRRSRQPRPGRVTAAPREA